MKLKFGRKKIASNSERNKNLITFHDPKNPISEAFRTIRTNIQFASVDKTLKTIMVTSTGPSEGKSTILSNLAIVFAQSDKNVLLVDADLRKPTIHHTFKLPNWIGLTSLLVDNKELNEAIQVSNVSNLSVLTSGPIPPNPAELLNSKKMLRFMESLKEKYDLILIDAPPVVAVTDAQVMSRYADGVLLVVNSGHTEKEMAVKAKQQLEQVKANVLGVILNNKEIQSDNYYYYYGN